MVETLELAYQHGLNMIFQTCLCLPFDKQWRPLRFPILFLPWKLLSFGPGKKLSKRDGSTEVTSARLNSSFRENGWTTLGMEGPGPLFNTLPRHCKMGTYPTNTPYIRCIGGCPHPKGFPTILLMFSLLLQDFHMFILSTCKVWWGYELLNSWPRVT